MGCSCGMKELLQDEEKNDDKDRISLDEIEKIKKSICKINYKEDEENKFKIGFFFKSKYFPKCIITSAIHIIERPLSKEKINVEIFNKKNISIELNGEERYIQVFAYVEILLIEIKDSDKIIKDINFLECDAIYFSGNEQYKDADRDIFTLQYFNNNYEIKKGKIGDYNRHYFEHNMDVNPDLLGSPIFSTNTLKVIGIQKMIDKDFDDENKVTKYGAFIGEIFKRSLYNKCINNYIIGVIDVTEEFSEYNNSLYIMNYYGNLAGDNKEYLNGNEIVQCTIEIDNIKYPFSDRRFFKDVGKYKIKYYFENHLTNCCALFFECRLLESLDFSNFDTKKIKYMSSMFENCTSLKEINFTNFNTENVIRMNGMFYDCSSLTNLDLSNFNTKKVNNMACLFSGCSSLVELNLSYFDTQNVEYMSYMFNKCSSLKN